MSNSEEEQFFETGEALASSSPFLGRVKLLAEEYASLEETIGKMEEMLASAKVRFNVIKSKELPELMAQAQTSVWSNEDKTINIEIDDFVSGTLPKVEDENDFEGIDRREKAINLLVEYGAADLIKTEVKLIFEKSEHNRALAVVDDLRQDGLEPSVVSGVHPQTLLAFVRERMKKGEPIDLDALGIYSGRIAKLKKPKKGK